MRCLIGLICVLAVSMVSVAQPARAQETLPPQLMLRPSYFYVDVDPVSARPTLEPAEEERPPSLGLSRGARIAIGVTVPIVALGVGVGIAAAVVSKNF
jgi:hypothetical protein